MVISFYQCGVKRQTLVLSLVARYKKVIKKITFAEVTKTALPTIKNDKPKNTQKSDYTKNDFNKKVDSDEFKISNVLIKKNDVVVVESGNETERNKIKKIME